MLAHDLKKILSILPELQPMIKQANIEEEYPLDNKDGAIASYIRYQYRTKVAGNLGGLDPDFIAKLEKAARMYGVREELDPLVVKLEKYAKAELEKQFSKFDELTVKQAEANFEGKLTGFVSISSLAKEAKELCSTYGDKITSEEVLRYAGKAFFNKEAAVAALQARNHATGRAVFTKVAEIINRDVDYPASEREANDICTRITELDEKSGLALKGFNIYKEAMLPIKQAATILRVRLANNDYPYEKIHRLGKGRISSYLGKDVGDAITDDPVHNKRVLESLPLDLQRMLVTVLKSA